MPYNENHKLVFRWEVFNVTNTQQLTSVLGDTFTSGLTHSWAGITERRRRRSAISLQRRGRLASLRRPALCSSHCAINFSGGDARLRSLKLCECSSLYIRDGRAALKSRGRFCLERSLACGASKRARCVGRFV